MYIWKCKRPSKRCVCFSRVGMNLSEGKNNVEFSPSFCYPWVIYIPKADGHLLRWAFTPLFYSWGINLWKTNKEDFLYTKPQANISQHQMVNDHWKLNIAFEVTARRPHPHLLYIVVRRLRVSSGALGCTCPGFSSLAFWNSSWSAWESCCTERERLRASQKLGCSRTCWIRELSIKSTVGSKWRIEPYFLMGTKGFK